MTTFPAIPRNRVGMGVARPGGPISYGSAAGVPVSFDGSHSFSLAGWFRLSDRAATGTLVGKQGEFVLGVKAGVPYARIAGQIGQVAAPAPLAAGWHFVCATYATTGARAGQLTLFIDGGQAAQAALSNVGAAPTTNLLASGGDIAVDVWCLCAYATALSPAQCACEWTPMADAGSTAASFCFMHPPARDMGPSHFPIAFGGTAAEMVSTPGVRFGGAGYALPSAIDTIDVSAGAYTLQAWIHPEANPAQGLQLAFAEGPGDGANVALGLATSATGTTSVFAQHGADTVSGGVVGTGRWANIAVTYDGTTLTLYLDGVACGTQASGAAALPAKAVVLGAATTSTPPLVAGTFQGTIQSVDVWTQALSAAQITTYASTPPIAVDGCVASFQLGFDSTNLITGATVGLYGGATAREILVPAAVAVDEDDALDLGIPLVAAQDHDEALLAAGPPAAVEVGVEVDALRAGGQRFLEDLRESYAAPGAGEVIAKIAADLAEQHDRYALTGLLPAGAVVAKREDGDLVFYRYGPSGPYEVHRQESLGTCADWYVELIVTCTAGLLSIFGVPFTTGRVAAAASRWIRRFPNAARAVAQGLTEEATVRTITAVFKVLYATNGLSTIIWDLLSNLSWWDFFFIGAAIILQFIEFIFPNPSSAVFYALVLAKIAALITQLVIVIKNKPTGC
jgi:hypothetical protein